MRILRLSIWILAAIAMVACSGGGVKPDASAFPVRGIDVSAHNGDIDFSAVAADSIRFAYIKATEGAEFRDPLFDRNYRKASQAGIKVGAYHFFRFDTPGHLQAYNFMNSLADKKLDLPAAIDVEDWSNAGEVPVNDVIDQLTSMVEVMHSAGRKIVIYTNKKGYDTYISGHFDTIQTWMCSLDAEPSDTINWAIWQYSHTGRVHGINGPVDLDAFRGPLPAFTTFATPSPTD